ncbi:MAG: hypothetical protein R2825_02315 [Saprospiraceae bacterium]
MAKSESLFQLVKSLDGSEKRYFKSFYGKGNNEQAYKFLTLFDKMVEQSRGEHYDEQQLLSELKDTFKPENFSYDKNYLFKAILKCLRNYYATKTPSLKLKELMIDISLLHEKGLVNDTLKHIQQAKKIAFKYDFKLPLLELMLMERRLIRQFTRKDIQNKLQNIRQDCQVHLNEIIQQFESLNIYENIFSEILHSEGGKKNIEKYDAQLKGVRNTIGPNNLRSFEIEIYSHLSYSMIYLLNGDHKKRLFHLKYLLELFEKNDYLLNDNQYNKRYINCLNNYINVCYATGELNELFKQIESMKALQPKNKDLAIQVQQLIYYSKILYFFKREEFETIVNIAPDIELFMEQYENHINLTRKIVFNLNLAAAFLLEKKYTEAHHKINQIINEPKFEVRKDIQMLARIFRVILLMEEKEYITAEYQINSAIRYLMKFRKNNVVEKEVLNALRKAAHSEDIKLLSPLLNLLENKNGYEEIYLWLKKTIGNY